MRRWICSWRSDKRAASRQLCCASSTSPRSAWLSLAAKTSGEDSARTWRRPCIQQCSYFFPTVARTVSGRVAPCIHLRPRAGFFCNELCKPFGVLASFFLAGRVG